MPLRVDECDWYCDECDALLNDQEGFDISTGKWICKKCGFENDISQNNIRKRKVHVFKCKKMGYGGEEIGIWFDADEYTEYSARSQFVEKDGSTLKENGEYYPYTYFEYNGERFYSVEYQGVFDEDDMPHGFSGYPWGSF